MDEQPIPNPAALPDAAPRRPRAPRPAIPVPRVPTPNLAEAPDQPTSMSEVDGGDRSEANSPALAPLERPQRPFNDRNGQQRRDDRRDRNQNRPGGQNQGQQQGGRPNGERQSFYQAARPKVGGDRPHMGMPPRNDGFQRAQNPTAGRNTSALTMTGQPHTPFNQVAASDSYVNRDPKNPNLRIIPLGGLEEIGKNMTIFEYGKDILVVDMGFQFPENDLLGVDYIIPDVSYLDDKKDRIRGAIITHGHLDHIGGVPYLVERLGFPTMYGTAVTMGMVKHRLEEFNLVARNKTVVIEPEVDVLQLGAFRIRTFRLNHSVPGAIGLEIETPNGRLVYATDWKFDYTPADRKPVDFRTLAGVGSRGVDILFSDSTNAEKPGFSISEKVVEKSITEAVAGAHGRVIVAMFASNLNRIQQTINAAAKNGRKVMIAGRSIQNNVEMAVNLKAVEFPANTLIADREAVRLPDDKLMVICTGAQGEERAALHRMASGEHRTIQIKKGDTVIISASPIPGNEKSVGGVMDLLYKAGANVVYNKTLDVHTTGHANAEELKLMVALMHPKYFIPLHGERNKRIVHGQLAAEVGVDDANIMLGDNGSVIEMDYSGRVFLTDEAVPAGFIIVDGLGIGDVGSIVLADRKAMAQEGIFVVISVFDTKRKTFATSPDIISRGFIYMRENEKFVNDIRMEIKRLLNQAVEKPGYDFATIKNDLRDYLQKVLYQKTERQPMVIPVIIEV
jgi:ribonuclease J